MGWHGSHASICIPIFIKQTHVRYRLARLLEFSVHLPLDFSVILSGTNFCFFSYSYLLLPVRLYAVVVSY